MKTGRFSCDSYTVIPQDIPITHPSLSDDVYDKTSKGFTAHNEKEKNRMLHECTMNIKLKNNNYSYVMETLFAISLWLMFLRYVLHKQQGQLSWFHVFILFKFS